MATPAARPGYRGGSYKARSAQSRALLYALIFVVTLWLIGPFIWLLVTSISYQRNLLARPLPFIPPEVTLENYRMILGLVRFHAEGQAAKILPSMLNTLIVASAVTLVNLVVGTTAGYAYARFRFPLKTFSLFALLFTRMLPTIVLIPAFFVMFRALGLQNTLTGLVVAYCSFTLPFTVWIMKAYFETVPADLDKSALVDARGAAGVGTGAGGGRSLHLHALLERVRGGPGPQHQAGHDHAAPGHRGHERPGQCGLLGDRGLRLPGRAARGPARADLPEVHGAGADRGVGQGLVSAPVALPSARIRIADLLP